MLQPPKQVLCVKDIQDIGFMLYSLLKGEGHDAVIAFTAAGALDLAGRGTFDLFILDTVLEGKSGLDLCRALRVTYPHTPVLFYSAAAYDSDREAALRAGSCG